MEIWDGYFRDGSLSGIDLIRGENIPDGLYHMVCEVLVRHVDGDYLLMQRALEKETYPGYFEATAGGSALKGEDKLACVKRELFEETGIEADVFEELGCHVFDDKHSIFYTYVCVTDWDKSNIMLQKGETIAFKWLNKKEFNEFLNSDKVIERQKRMYIDYFKENGFTIE